MSTDRTSRNNAPVGVLTKKPVGLRLLPHEQEALAKRAATENRSLANMARHFVLIGLDLPGEKPTHTVTQPHSNSFEGA